MRVLFSFGLAGLAAGLFFSCSGETDPVSGGINGTVVPAESAREVYLIKGTDTLKTTPTSDGNFALTEVPAGWYDLAVRPAMGFEQPKMQRIIITAGQTMQAQAIKPERFSVNGKFSVTLDGKELSAAITKLPGGGPGFSATTDGYTFSFGLPEISGLDTFNTATNSDLKLVIIKNNNTWMAFDTLGSTSLKITRFDQTTQRGDAIFTFTAGSETESELKGSNGKLAFVKFK